MAVVCTTTLPAVRADYCTPGVAFGQIKTVYYTRVGDGLTDWTSAAEWNTRLDNTTAAPSAGAYPIRYLNVVGSLDAPDQTEVEISNDRFAYADPEFTINFTVDDVGDDNYSFVQTLITNNGGIFAVWFASGGYMYGSTDGTQMTMKMVPQIPEDKNDIMRFVGTLKWTGTMPGRTTNPL